jgi:1-deoxy-D-xylulose-5-phosphate reductoisomerase
MKKENKNISILGSTGSIGKQTLEVLQSLNSDFSINFLSANKNFQLLNEQAIKYNPKAVIITDKNAYDNFLKITDFQGKVFYGTKGILEAINLYNNDLIVSALVGFSGVIPTLEAIRNGADVALANKESLVSAGKIITDEAKIFNTKILAVDSEHSAILQCIAGEKISEIEKLILTASGGPFRNVSYEEFKNITVKDALNHPNWSMGSKITIDSATMINKGFEVIEAYWLFGVDIESIDVLVHPQSIVHSLVQFIDGSVKAQLGLPDMRIPISYALNFPRRFEYDFPRMNLAEIGTLTFELPDLNKFRSLKLAYQAIKMGGNSPAVLNAVNEVAVRLFLEKEIKFINIAELIESVLDSVSFINNPTIDEIIISDTEARSIALEKYKELI